VEVPEQPEYMLPHSDFGDPECCGLFCPIERGDSADITCNECGLVLKSVPVADLRRTLDEMELTLEVASEKCPHCGAVNLFPGFSGMLAFTCRECGQAVRVEDNRDE
jgi:RNase P subunit RPR2